MSLVTLLQGEKYTATAGDMIIPAGLSAEGIYQALLDFDTDGLIDNEVRRMLDERDYEADATPLGREIYDACYEIARFLAAKNRAYGNSAGNPIGIFAKRLDTLAQIDVRIDDKLNRLSKGSEYPGDDTIMDLVGYLVLRIIVKNREDAE